MGFGIGDIGMLLQTLNSSSFRDGMSKLQLDVLDALLTKLKLMVNDGIQLHELDSLKNVLKEIGGTEGVGEEIRTAIDKLIKKIEKIKLLVKVIVDDMSELGISPNQLSGNNLGDLLQKVMMMIEMIDGEGENDPSDDISAIATGGVQTANLGQGAFTSLKHTTPLSKDKKTDLITRVNAIKENEKDIIINLHNLARDLLLVNIVDTTIDIFKGQKNSDKTDH
ncbi:hypothetical protein DID77_00830 [Candidatus Marinamargulisbacteria bacterium SCGC AG-439-L15]|nr:hypothetical protein DID77_00830 [Candidatus Marinamargulisbacteria bacterium SCGC AG-439-L15]